MIPLFIIKYIIMTVIKTAASLQLLISYSTKNEKCAKHQKCTNPPLLIHFYPCHSQAWSSEAGGNRLINATLFIAEKA
jgi:hypothetical protein